MNAQNHGQTREDIARLEKQAADYLAKAASLLNLDLDRHAEEAHSVGDAPQKLKGMMDADDAGDAEDNWSAPQRQLHLPPTHHVDDHHSQRGAGHHSHRSAELEPAHEDHLPDITLGHRPSATGSQRHLLSYPSGLIKDGHELHKVFQHYASVKYGHEELDVFEFKKMCRELNLTSNRFTSGAAEAAFRRFLASAPIAEGEGDSRREHRIHFGSFGALLKIVAHERACLYDAVVNIILNNFEEGHEIHDFPAL